MNSEGDNGKQAEYLVSECRGRKVSETRMTREAKGQLNPDDVDFLWDEATGQFRIRTKRGKVIEYFGTLPGIGDELRRMLLDLIWQPGELLSPQRCFPSSTMNPKYLRGIVTARLARLRRAFGESAAEPWFFLARRVPYSICWNGERSWRFIERLAPPNGSAQGASANTL